MANNLNTVTVVGNVTRDPEVRYTAGGVAKATFGLAVNRSWMNRQTNEWEEQTSFLNVVCWREMADNVSHSITKGARVIVTGRVEQRSWETDQGEKRSIIEIVADEIGPSLRWATVTITKNERRGPGEYEAQRSPASPSAPAPAAVAPAAAPASTGYDEYSEEPF